PDDPPAMGQPLAARVEMLGEAARLEEGGHQVTTGHATKWSGSRSSRPGTARRQSATAKGQRAAKRQPASGRRRSGGTPSMEVSGWPKRLGWGRHWSRPRVYG